MWLEFLIDVARSWFAIALLIAVAAGVLYDLTLGILALLEARRQLQRYQMEDRLALIEGDPPPISILVPCRDKSESIVESVRSLVELRYPTYEIIVVNNGSVDDTLEVLTRAFGLVPSRRTTRARVDRGRLRGAYASPQHPYLLVLDIEGGGMRGSALNTALAFSRYPYFSVIDADTVPEPDTLVQLVMKPYLDASAIAVAGVVRPAAVGGSVEVRRSGRIPRSPWLRFQIIEYLRMMLASRMAWAWLDRQLKLTGAPIVFVRDLVMRVGGYRDDQHGEDIELIARLQRWAARNRHRNAVRFSTTAVAWTDAPNHLSALVRQRVRWQRGVADALCQGRRLIMTGPGWAVAYLIQTLNLLVRPVVEILATLLFIALALTGNADTEFAVFFFIVVVAGGTVASLLAVSLEASICPRHLGRRDPCLLTLYAFLENFGYRQVTQLCRVAGLWQSLRGRPDPEAQPRPIEKPAELETPAAA